MTTPTDQPHLSDSPPEGFERGFMSSHGATGAVQPQLVTNDGVRVRMRITWQPHLCRSASTQSMHTGPIITTIDSAMGMVGMHFMEHQHGIATVDFRYDEFVAPPARGDVICEAHCERIDGDILFLTGACYAADGETLLGRAAGRFIRTPRQSTPLMQQMFEAQAAARVEAQAAGASAANDPEKGRDA